MNINDMTDKWIKFAHSLDRLYVNGAFDTEEVDYD